MLTPLAQTSGVLFLKTTMMGYQAVKEFPRYI